MNRVRADALLFITSVIWGSTFVAQKYGNEAIPPMAFVGVKFLLSTLCLLPLAIFEARRPAAPRIDGKTWAIVASIGACLLVGSVMQQIGLLWTTVSNSGFLTALYVMIVPFIVWGISKARPRRSVLLACAVSIFGAWLLTTGGHFQAWNKGDVVTVISDLAWALGIALIPIFLHRCHRPFFLCFAQYLITAIFSLAASFFFEPRLTYEGLAQAAAPLLYAGVMSGGVAYTLQTIAQKHTPPAEASLILSLESVFAALSGAFLLGERLSLTAIAGCCLIMMGVVISETAPLLRARTGKDLGR